jgi:hypothetical protein
MVFGKSTEYSLPCFPNLFVFLCVEWEVGVVVCVASGMFYSKSRSNLYDFNLRRGGNQRSKLVIFQWNLCFGFIHDVVRAGLEMENSTDILQIILKISLNSCQNCKKTRLATSKNLFF